MNERRVMGVAELLKHYTPAQVAAMLSKADKGDVSGAIDIALGTEKQDEPDRPQQGPPAEAG